MDDWVWDESVEPTDWPPLLQVVGPDLVPVVATVSDLATFNVAVSDRKAPA